MQTIRALRRWASIVPRAANSAVRVPSSHGGSRRFESTPPIKLTAPVLRADPIPALAGDFLTNLIEHRASCGSRPGGRPGRRPEWERKKWRKMALFSMAKSAISPACGGGFSTQVIDLAASSSAGFLAPEDKKNVGRHFRERTGGEPPNGTFSSARCRDPTRSDNSAPLRTAWHRTWAPTRDETHHERLQSKAENSVSGKPANGAHLHGWLFRTRSTERPFFRSRQESRRVNRHRTINRAAHSKPPYYVQYPYSVKFLTSFGT